MTQAERRAFLIDADNVKVELIEEALDLKEREHGPFHVKRCYCSAEFALRNLPFLQRRSIRAMVNVTAGKNCNDIALAIDAVLLCQPEAPSLVVIVGSRRALAMAVRNATARARWTWLAERIRGAAEAEGEAADADADADADA